MRIEEKITMRSRPSDVWAWVGDPARYPKLVDGVTRWQPENEGREVRVGARYTMRMLVGSVEVGGLVEVVECQPCCDLAWTGVTGIDQRGRWRVREVSPGVTSVTFRLSYHAPGGVWGLIADQLSAVQVRRSMRRTLTSLQARVEKAAGNGWRSTSSPTDVVAHQLRALRVLGETGLLRPSRLDRAFTAALALHRWGFSLPGGVAAAAARFPGETAIIDERGSLTFADVDRRTIALANAFAEAGIREGDRVGILCRNHRGFIEASVALAKVGADILYLNTGFAGPQLREVLQREGAVALVSDAEFSRPAAQALAANRRFIAWSEARRPPSTSIERLIDKGSTREPEPPERPSRTTILTSGTTGAPKGAMRSRPRTTDPLLAVLSRIPLRAREPTLIAAPLFHAWGFVHLGLGVLLSSTIVLRRTFDPEDVLATIAEHRVTTLAAVPVMLQRILDLPPELRARHDTSSLRVVAVSGSALSGELALRFMDTFGDVIYNLYGSTEVGWATIATPEDLRAAPGTAGRPPEGTVVRLLDERGRDVEPGAAGRIFVGNEMLFEGYTGGGGKDMVDGLMGTGDVGRFDEDGRLFVEGRDDEMIVSGGENVFPAEVEELLTAHGKIAEAAVVGVPDPQWGQSLSAYVVVSNGARLSANDVKTFVKRRLARYKVPRDVTFVRSLPRGDAGKVIKRELETAERG